MRKIIFILVLSASVQLTAQMACKDTIFSFSMKENMCLFNIWGEWKVDSAARSDANLKPGERSEVWSFKSNLSMSRTFIMNSKQESITATYKFIQGYFELTKTYDGSTIYNPPLSYKVIHISPTRMELLDMCGQTDGSCFRYVLKKIK